MTDQVNTEDVNTGDAVEVTGEPERKPLVSITSDTSAFVEVTVQLATGESATFSRSYVGGLDTSPLEILDALAEAMKTYLETF